MDQKCSVLMSVYQKEKAEYLSASLESMRNQTICPDEIVLVEDGPLNEGLYSAINTFDRKNPGLLRILKNETNLGLGLSLQKGVLECRNELIARMDSDDLSRPYRLEHQLNRFAQEPGLSICGGNIEEFTGDDLNAKVGIREVPDSDAEIRTFMKKRCPFNHMTVMFRKSAVLSAGNYQHFLYNEDYLLWIHMAEAGCVFANLNEILVDVRTEPDLYENRRGGNAYYQSEKGIQKILLEKKMISFPEYERNIAERFLLQKVMTPSLRAFVFRHFARTKTQK